MDIVNAAAWFLIGAVVSAVIVMSAVVLYHDFNDRLDH